MSLLGLLALRISFYNALIRSLLTLVFASLYPRQNPPLSNLSGKVAIVTGANSGIGSSIAVALAKQGATVYLACRNPRNFDSATHHVISKANIKENGRVHCWKVDVGDLESVREFCERWEREGRAIDVLVHNAGIAGVPDSVKHDLDRNGRKEVDLMYKTNFLGSFLMTHLLERHLNAIARIVFTSSTGHYAAKFPSSRPKSRLGIIRNSILRPASRYMRAVNRRLGIASDAPAYAQSKAQQVIFAKLLQRQFASSGYSLRSAHAFTPGFTSTPIFGKFDTSWKTWFQNPLFMALKVTESSIAVDTDEGAKTGWWLASAEGIEGGGYWERMTRRTSLADVLTEEVLRSEWARWERDARVTWSCGPRKLE